MAVENDILDLAASMNCQELHCIVDNESGLRAIIAIHNTKLGPALGGCRWVEYSSTYDAAKDAIRLAEGMTYKSAISGLPLGGGKAVLMKPKGNIDKEKYFKAFGRFLNNLGGRYITAVDSGTSPTEMDIISTESKYVSNTTHSEYSSADPSPFTALGVFLGIKAAVKYKLDKDNLNGIHVAIQGLGHVGYPLAKKLYEDGAKLTVFDINKDVMQRCVTEFNAKVVSDNNEIFSVECDVFAPCALGAAVNSNTIPLLKASIVAGAANNQLAYPDQDAKALFDKGILYAPDFVINAGGIIYVAGEHIHANEVETIQKIEKIYDTLLEVFKRSDKENKTTYEVAHDIALEKLQLK